MTGWGWGVLTLIDKDYCRFGLSCGSHRQMWQAVFDDAPVLDAQQIDELVLRCALADLGSRLFSLPDVDRSGLYVEATLANPGRVVYS